MKSDELAEKYKDYRLYILVNKQFRPSVAVNSAGHGCMAAGLMWKGEEHFDGWYDNNFKKVTCAVDEVQLALIRKILESTGLKSLEQVENRLGGVHVLTVIYPFDTTDRRFKAFQYLPLYGKEYEPPKKEKV